MPSSSKRTRERQLAKLAAPYYNIFAKGGEGHMEVAKNIYYTVKKKAHMVLSLKPFGCMPSSGVSDGVQSMITGMYPQSIFCAIETTGDGAVNVQSRVLMYLFKARQAAQQEYDALRQASGRSQQELEHLARRHRYAASALLHQWHDPGPHLQHPERRSQAAAFVNACPSSKASGPSAGSAP